MIPTTDTLRRAAEILQSIEKLQSEMVGIFSNGGMVTPAKRRGRPPGKGKHRTMSPEARARIGEATKARWAKRRAGKRKAAK